MLGRFFTPPLLLAVMIISSYDFSKLKLSTVMISYVAITILGFAALLPTPSTELPADFDALDQRWVYARFVGLLKARRTVTMPDHSWRYSGEEVKTHEGNPVAVRLTLGMYGFYAGPMVHVIDRAALADPLLARLPAYRNPTWWIGHFERVIPEGYQDTLYSRKNRIKDKNLALFYDKLSIITRGSLWDANRLVEIWNMNTGKYDDLIDFDAYRYPDMEQVPLSQVNVPKDLTQPGEVTVSNSGVQIDLETLYHASSLEVSLDSPDDFEMVFLDGREEIAKVDIPASYTSNLMTAYSVTVPSAAAAQGYDRIRIFPARGDDEYSLGYLKVSPLD